MHYTESTFLFRFEFLYFRICLFSLIAHGYNGWTFLIPPVTYVSFFFPESYACLRPRCSRGCFLRRNRSVPPQFAAAAQRVPAAAVEVKELLCRSCRNAKLDFVQLAAESCAIEVAHSLSERTR